jgi:hypothetical protein
MVNVIKDLVFVKMDGMEPIAQILYAINVFMEHVQELLLVLVKADGEEAHVMNKSQLILVKELIVTMEHALLEFAHAIMVGLDNFAMCLKVLVRIFNVTTEPVITVLVFANQAGLDLNVIFQ